MLDNKLIAKQIGTWLQQGHTGRSSIFMASIALGYEPKEAQFNYPLDPSDLGRCIKLIEFAPDFVSVFPKISEASPVWGRLIANWDELTAIYHEEAPSGNAPRCYSRMKELIDQE